MVDVNELNVAEPFVAFSIGFNETGALQQHLIASLESVDYERKVAVRQLINLLDSVLNAITDQFFNGLISEETRLDGKLVRSVNNG